MKKHSILPIAAALMLGATPAYAQWTAPGPDSTRDSTPAPKEPEPTHTVILMPDPPHATTSETTGNSRNSVGTTLIEQQDRTLAPDISQAPPR